MSPQLFQYVCVKTPEGQRYCDPLALSNCIDWNERELVGHHVFYDIFHLIELQNESVHSFQSLSEKKTFIFPNSFPWPRILNWLILPYSCAEMIFLLLLSKYWNLWWICVQACGELLHELHEQLAVVTFLFLILICAGIINEEIARQFQLIWHL